MELLRGKTVSDNIKASVEEKIASLNGDVPVLAIIRVGERPGDISYENSATKKLSGMGIKVVSVHLPADIDQDIFKKEFSAVNDDEKIDGILIMRPLPKRLKEAEHWMEMNIHPDKDIDCIGPHNLAGIMRSKDEAFAPCTAQSAIEILKGYDIDLKGKNVALIGRSMVIGKPLSMMLLKEDATVTVCHTKTADVPGICRSADIIISAAGHAGIVGPEYVRQGQVIIDVGTSVDENGKLVGDVDLAAIEAAGITDIKATPVPGGVGVVTTAVLAKHVCLSKIRHMM